MRFCGLFICVLLAGSVAAAELPGSSFANFSKPVRKEIEKNLKLYLNKKHGCKRYTVRDTRGVKEVGDIIVDAKRRLMAGTIVEEWDLDACDKLLTLTLAIAADGAAKGDVFLAIAEKEPKGEAVEPTSAQPAPAP